MNSVRKFTGIILVDKDKKILLQHRDSNARSFQDSWAFFGGGFEENETKEECVVRETMEELSYDLKEPIFFKEYFFDKEETKLSFNSVNYIFYKKISEKDKKNLVLGEGDDMAWFSISDLEKIKIHHRFKEILKEVNAIL